MIQYCHHSNQITMSSRAYRPPTGSRALRVPTGKNYCFFIKMYYVILLGGRPPTGGLRTGMVWNWVCSCFNFSFIQRPGSRSGQPQLGGALNAQITVPDRPVTQQGLGGMSTSTRGEIDNMDIVYAIFTIHLPFKFIHPSIYSPIDPLILSLFLSIYLFIHPSIHPSIHVSNYSSFIYYFVHFS